MSDAGPAERECPQCGETIKAAAKKCRFCGVFFDPSLEAKRRGRQAPKRGPDGREVGSSVMILVGLPGYFVCGVEHICMAGHWQHPPYPDWHYLTEFAWVVGFVFAAVVIVQSETCRRWVRCLTLAGLVASRLVLGGALMPIEFLVAIVLGIAAVSSLVRRAS